jgi:transcriptional regulator with XRE-family HTH domain
VDRESSGIQDLDVLLGGLIAGDNVVWVGDDEHLLGRIEQAFLEEGRRRGVPCQYVTTERSPSEMAERLGEDVVVLDARPRGRVADPVVLEQTLVQAAIEAPGRVVVDALDTYVRRLGRDRALALFSRVCPRLFDLGAFAYWRASRRRVGAGLLEEVRKVTQCVFEVNAGHLRVLKAEGRAPSVQGRLLRLQVRDGVVHLENERALGRLGEGLRRLRQERGLTQAGLARIAGVSSSAISQAEAGHRGLSLDTLLAISEGLGVALDELLRSDTRSDYVLARRDPTALAPGHTALLDDPKAGLRAYLVTLGPGQRGTPPLPHKGVEMVLVAQGLVQVDLGSGTPVMRSGDAVLAGRAPVKAWRNLLGQPARLFWILRD